MIKGDLDQDTFELWFTVVAEWFGKKFNPKTIVELWEVFSDDFDGDTDAFIETAKRIIHECDRWQPINTWINMRPARKRASNQYDPERDRKVERSKPPEWFLEKLKSSGLSMPGIIPDEAEQERSLQVSREDLEAYHAAKRGMISGNRDLAATSQQWLTENSAKLPLIEKVMDEINSKSTGAKQC